MKTMMHPSMTDHLPVQSLCWIETRMVCAERWHGGGRGVTEVCVLAHGSMYVVGDFLYRLHCCPRIHSRIGHLCPRDRGGANGILLAR